ncbi:unnamed protein product [Diamesa hyperborea]
MKFYISYLIMLMSCAVMIVVARYNDYEGSIPSLVITGTVDDDVPESFPRDLPSIPDKLAHPPARYFPRYLPSA